MVEENNANIHAENEFALRWSAQNGHLEVVKYLAEKGADIHAYNEFALRRSAENGHLHWRYSTLLLKKRSI